MTDLNTPESPAVVYGRVALIMAVVLTAGKLAFMIRDYLFPNSSFTLLVLLWIVCSAISGMIVEGVTNALYNIFTRMK